VSCLIDIKDGGGRVKARRDQDDLLIHHQSAWREDALSQLLFFLLDSNDIDLMEAEEEPRGFRKWRLACEAITGLSRYPQDKPGESSRSGRFILPSSIEKSSSKDANLGMTGDELNELQDILDTYVETDAEKKMHGVVEQWKNELIRTSPMIRFMAKHLSLVGCSPYNETISSSIKLPPILISGCPPNLAGGFSPPQPGRPPSESGILICSNRIMNKKHLENTMAHEMIHWWDNCRFQVDWNNLRHHACTEVSIEI
jgi:hypothetical protein